MTLETFPDVEGALRTWLRAQVSLTALVGQRVFFGVPKGATEVTFPLVTIQRVGGGDDPSTAPVDRPIIQIDCWGSLDQSGNGRKAEATALVNTVRALLQSIENTSLTATCRALGTTVESVIWLPDPDNDRPRYSVTAEVMAISS